MPYPKPNEEAEDLVPQTPVVKPHDQRSKQDPNEVWLGHDSFVEDDSDDE